MKRKVLLSNPAKTDIRRIITYIRLDKPVAAEKFKGILKTKIRSLEKLSQRGRKVPELAGTAFEDYRELVLKPCRILYKISGHEIRILRILHSRMQFVL